MLDELGLGADVIDQGRRCTAEPWRPAASPFCRTIRRLATTAPRPWRDSPARAESCWSAIALDPRLGAVLGFGHTKYVRQGREGQFAAMRFDAADVAGLPTSVRQKSWNITAAEPTGHNARVIGRWYDDDGNADRLSGRLAERSRRVSQSRRAAG